MSQVLDAELDALLLRVVPGFGLERRGASPDDIAAIETLAQQALPEFYRWFLSTMGASTGALARALDGFSASEVLRAYREGDVELTRPFLYIGTFADEVIKNDYYYDLSRPARDDALLVNHTAGGYLRRHIAETFREYIGWSALGLFRVSTADQQCLGLFDDIGEDAAGELKAVMAGLGYRSPLTTGPYCALFESDTIAMVCDAMADEGNTDGLVFRIGAPDAGTTRRLLGEIASRSRLDVQIHLWTPAVGR